MCMRPNWIFLNCSQYFDDREKEKNGVEWKKVQIYWIFCFPFKSVERMARNVLGFFAYPHRRCCCCYWIDQFRLLSKQHSIELFRIPLFFGFSFCVQAFQCVQHSAQYECMCVFLHKHFSLYVEICVIWEIIEKIGSPALSFIDDRHRCVIIIIVTVIAIVRRFFDFIFKQWAWRAATRSLLPPFFQAAFLPFFACLCHSICPPYHIHPIRIFRFSLRIWWMCCDEWRIHGVHCVYYIYSEAINSD